MKSCPTCKRTFDDTLTFCLVDGSILSAPLEPQETQHLPAPDRTDAPTEVIYEIPTTPPTQQAKKDTSVLPTITAPVPPLIQAHQTSSPLRGKRHTSNWLIRIVGGLFAILIIGIIALTLASRNLSPTENVNVNTNTTSNSNIAVSANTSTTSNTNSTSNSNSIDQQRGKQDFTLVNRTGVEIDKVFISPHDSDDWQKDILGQDTLPSGQSVEIKFHRNEKATMWDLRIEDKQGNAIEWENLNLLEISKVTVRYKDGKGTAEVE
jgi:hypothetical protein